MNRQFRRRVRLTDSEIDEINYSTHAGQDRQIADAQLKKVVEWLREQAENQDFGDKATGHGKGVVAALRTAADELEAELEG